MSVIIHFINGNDQSIENHYLQKEYRNDIIIEIDEKFYEVYFFIADSLEFEMTKDGFFSLPGLIILDKICNEKIYAAINGLIDIGYFENFIGSSKLSLDKSFSNKWYINRGTPYNLKAISRYVLRP